jgi:hypothetical protein
MRALLLDLRIIPAGVLPTAVLEEDDLARRGSKRSAGRVDIEGDLHPFPVTFVKIVELIEVIEKPVLQRETGMAGLPGDVRIGHGRGAPGPPEGGEILGVGAARLERVTRQVQVVTVAEPRQVRRCWSAFDETGAVRIVLSRRTPGSPRTASTDVGGAYCSSEVSHTPLSCERTMTTGAYLPANCCAALRGAAPAGPTAATR